MLNESQLAALKKGAKDGWLQSPQGLRRLELIKPRSLYDEVRRRSVPMGDYELTAWGYQVARFYEHSVERLPVGTLINHRIHAYKAGTVVLSDDSNEICTVDREKPLLVEPGMWSIPLKEGGHTLGTEKEGWYLRNLLGMDIKLRKGSSPNDFRID